MSEVLKQNAKLLLRKAYFKLLDDYASAQEQIVKARAHVAVFGAHAMLKDRMSSIGSFKRASENINRHIDFYNKRMCEMEPIIKALEELFDKEEEAELEAFADWIRETHGTSKQKKSKRGK